MKARMLSFLAVALVALTLGTSVAEALPRSGGSFGSRGGFRSGGGSFSRNYSTGRNSYGGGGSHFIFLPSFGYGWGGYGGGSGMFGSLLMLAVVGFGAVAVMRAVRAARGRGSWQSAFGGRDVDETPDDRAYVYKIQLGLGRSGREIQSRLARFAAEGDTSSESGLAQLLQQTALELMRHKDSIRYGAVEASGPMSLTNGETKMNAISMAERARFTVERVRGADGHVRRSEAVVEESADVLEYLVITLVVATRSPLPGLKTLQDPSDLQPALGALGAIPANGLLGLEVIWTPADPQDALTGDDLHTTYPEMRSL